MSNQSTRKASVDNDTSKSVDRSSNGGRTGSNERVLKLKINKNKTGIKTQDKGLVSNNKDGKN
jgi:hypothetical protein